LSKLQKIKEGRTTETGISLRRAHKDVQLALAAAGGERARLPILNQIDLSGQKPNPSSEQTILAQFTWHLVMELSNDHLINPS
jgi:hypothetical protein